MTRTRRLLTVTTALLVVLSVPTAVWAFGAPASGAQQAADTTVEVTDIDAPAFANAGEVINVTATVTLVESANATATPTATAGPNATEEPNATQAPNATETVTVTTTANATETANATDAPNATTTTDATGGEAQAVPVEFRLDGDVLLRDTLTLEPGESQNVTFQVNTSGLAPGVYVHSVLAGDSGEDATLLVVDGDDQPAPTPDPNSTSFQVSNLSAPSEVAVGDPVEVTATVSNPVETNGTETPAPNATEVPNETESPTATATATATAVPNATQAPNATDAPNATETPSPTAETQRVEFRVEGDVVAARNVTLEPGESTVVNFTLNTTGIEPGVYTHGVLTEDFGEMAVLQVVEATGNVTETPAPTETSAPTESPGTSTPTEGTPMGTDTATDGTTDAPTDETETA